MIKAKYLVPLLLSLAVIGCSSEPKELTDDEYFSIMKPQFDNIADAWRVVAEPLMTYSQDDSQYAQMQKPAEEALALFEKEVEELKSIRPVPGWEERHELLISTTTYFEELTREAVRTSKNGIKTDLGAKSEQMMSNLKEMRNLEEIYRPDSE